MKFWRKKREQVEQAVDDVAATATDLAGKTLTIGPGAVLLMLGVGALGAAATYYAAKHHKNKKAARSGAASSKSGKSD